MLQPGTGLGKAPIVTFQKRRCDFAPARATERRDSRGVGAAACNTESYHARQIASIGRHRDVIDDGVIGGLGASSGRRHRDRHGSRAERCVIRRWQRATGRANEPRLGRHLIGARRAIELHNRHGYWRNVDRSESVPLPARHTQYIAEQGRDRPVAERHARRRCHSAQFFRAHRALAKACRTKRATIDSPPLPVELAPSPAVTPAK
jgi:hypothetical protein